jgi:hypothetical protein
MSFATELRAAAGQLSAAECAKAVSPLLSKRTVEDWMQARREPPAWAQEWLLTRIKRARARAERKSPPRNADH